MSLGTYTELQAAIAAELNRGDLASQVPDFITRFEARARRELRDWLRQTITATTVTADYALPATVQEVLSVAYNDGPNGAHNFMLRLVDREEYQSWMELASTTSSTAGQLAYVDVDVDTPTQTLRFWPPATATGPIANLKIEIVKALPSLSASQATNALLRDAPDIYLNGSCAEAEKYLQHDERIPLWVADRDAGFRGLRIQTERKQFSGVPRDRPLARVFG